MVRLPRIEFFRPLTPLNGPSAPVIIPGLFITVSAQPKAADK
jgi:hypothetical protein